MCAVATATVDPLDGFHCPPDVTTARESFQASLGHAAIAALVGVDVADAWHAAPMVLPLTFAGALRALRRLGAEATEVPTRVPREPGERASINWPERGLLFVEIHGPWKEGRHGLVVAVERDRHGNWWVYDPELAAEHIAAPYQGKLGAEGGGWLLSGLWTTHVIRERCARIPKASGSWWARAAIAVPARRSA